MARCVKRSFRTPKYRRHGTGQAFVEIQGKRIYLGRYGSDVSRQRYGAIIAELTAAPGDLHSIIGKPADDMDVAELLDRFFAWAEGYYKGSRELLNFKTPAKALLELYGALPAAKFSPTKLIALQRKLIDAGHSRHYINGCIRRIRQFFKFGVTHELLPVDVLNAIRTVDGLRAGRSAARETNPVRAVTENELNAVLPHVSPVVADMIQLQYLCGARPGEICALRPADLDISGRVWLYRPPRHKTSSKGRIRMIPIGPRGQEILRPYLNRPVQAPCFSPAESEQQRRERLHEQRVTPMSCGNRPGTNRRKRPGRKPGETYTTATFARAIARGCEAAGLTGSWSPNQLRHAAAMRMRREAGWEAARALLGHSAAAVTEVYAAEADLAIVSEPMLRIG